MKIDVYRKTRSKKSTIGELFLDDKFFCFTLEDVERDLNHDGQFDNGEIKVYGQTAIPEGTYKVIVDHSAHFNKDLPRILNVPGFEGVRIHGGNTEADTLGCILIGFNSAQDRIWNSASAKLTEILEQYRELNITIHS